MREPTPSSAGRTTARDLVTRRPLTSFVVLACSISWTAWLLSERIDLGVVNGFGVLFSTGPALSAMVVSALLKPEPSGEAASRRQRLFWVVTLLAVMVMAARRLWVTPEWLTVAGSTGAMSAFPTPLAFPMDVVAAAAVAFILSGVASSRQGVRDLLQSLDPRRRPVRWYWWVVAVGLYPAVLVAGQAVSAGLGVAEPTPQASGPWYRLAFDVLLTFFVLLFHGGGLEEPGWRGFALPRLQKRLSPLRSSLILAAVWGLWHWPFFWSSGWLDATLGILFYVLLEVAPLAVLFTAVYNRTGGSLPIVILLHTSINTTAMFLPASALASVLWLGLLVAMAVWMWRSPQTFSPRPAAEEAAAPA